MTKTIQINLLQASNMLGKDYNKGIHKVLDTIKKDKQYLSLSKAGLVQEVVDQKTIDDENKAIANENKALKAKVNDLEAEIKKLKK